MYLIAVVILALDCIALYFRLKESIRERDEAEERAVTHFKRAERYFKYNILIEKIDKIISSENFTFDKVEKIKELISDRKSKN